MATEMTIESLANLMIERYGEEASYTAAERSRVLRDCNDRQSSRTWFLVSMRIDQIASPLPKSDSLRWPERIDRMPSTSAGADPVSGLGDELVEDAELVT